MADRGADGGVHRCAATAAAHLLGVRGRSAQNAGRAGSARPGGAGSAEAAASGIPGFAPDLDPGRANAVLPVLSLLLGLGEAYDDDFAGVAR